MKRRVEISKHRTGRRALAALAAGFGLLLTTTIGQGAIIYYWGQNISIPNTFAGVSVDLEAGTSSTSLAGLTGGDANLFSGGQLVGNDADEGATVPTWQPVRTGTGNTDAIANLAGGVTVDGSSTYSTGYGISGSPNSHFGVAAGDFTAGGTGYIGFSLVIDDPENPGSDLTTYGWMLVRLEDGDASGLILEWAYDTTGAPIIVGVPEPATAGIFGGLAALALLRRRRN